MSAFASQKDADVYHARVLLAQARTFRLREASQGRGAYSQWLLNRACAATRRAISPEQVKRDIPIQAELF